MAKKCDGMTITMTPRDELIQVREKEGDQMIGERPTGKIVVVVRGKDNPYFLIFYRHYKIKYREWAPVDELLRGPKDKEKLHEAKIAAMNYAFKKGLDQISQVECRIDNLEGRLLKEYQFSRSYIQSLFGVLPTLHTAKTAWISGAGTTVLERWK